VLCGEFLSASHWQLPLDTGYSMLDGIPPEPGLVVILSRVLDGINRINWIGINPVNPVILSKFFPGVLGG